MNAELVSELEAPPREAPRRRVLRARVVSGLGPGVAVVGLIWALAQPYRVTLLHPLGQGFWWLFVEPQLLVIVVGLLFHFAVVPGLVRDLEESDAAAG